MRTLLVGLALVAGLALAQDKVHKVVQPGKAGGVVRVSATSDPKTFNPFVARETSSTDVTNLLFPFLSNYGAFDLKPGEGLLAKSLEPSRNGLSMTVKLREGVKWSDGRPITADDVIFSAEAHQDAKVNSSQRSGLFLDGKPFVFSKTDAYTVKIDFPKSYARANILTFSVVPKHVFEGPYKAGKIAEVYDLNTPPAQIVSGGPFVIEAYQKGERVVMRRNPNFWGVDERGNRLPYLERYIFNIVPNSDADFARFLNGDTDFSGTVSNAFNVPEADKVAAVLERVRDGKLKAEIFPNVGVNASTTFVVFNWNNKNDFRADLFRQVKFRRAMAHLMDKKAMIEVAFGGLGQPLWSPVPSPNTAFHNPNVPKYEFDPKRAQQLLAELGFNRKDKDGWLVNAKGQRLEFNLDTNQDSVVRVKMSQVFAEDARKAGVKVEFRPSDFNDLVRRLTNPDAAGLRDFDAILIGLTASLDPDNGRNTWQLNGSLHAWNLGVGGKAPARVEPFEVLIDKLMTQGATTLDPAQRRQIYNQFQQVVGENLPLIYTVSPAFNPARLSRVGGLFGKDQVGFFIGQYPYAQTLLSNE